MFRKLWFKGTLTLLATGMTLAMGYGGCLEAAVQRILVAVAFD